VTTLYSPGWDEGGEDFLDERDYAEALIVAAYKFAGVPDPERLAAVFLAQSRPLRIRVVKEDPPGRREPLRARAARRRSHG